MGKRRYLQGVWQKFRTESPHIKRGLELLENAISDLADRVDALGTSSGGGDGGVGVTTGADGALYVTLSIFPGLDAQQFSPGMAVGYSIVGGNGWKKLMCTGDFLGDGFVGVVESVDRARGRARVMVAGEIEVSYAGPKPNNLKAGELVFASTTAGAVTRTRPTSQSQYVIRVGEITDPMTVTNPARVTIFVDARERMVTPLVG